MKCEPRSTRRTSENNFRANVKKPFGPSKRHSTSITSQWSLSTAPRNLQSSDRHEAMRAAPLIDFRTSVKLGQESPELSGYPTLTPLPTYSSQIVDDCFSYSSSPELNPSDPKQQMELNSCLNLGRHTPQTPEPIIYQEPVSNMDGTDNNTTCHPWSDEALALSQLGFDLGMAELLPMNIWSASETAQMMPVPQMSWLHSGFMDSLRHVPIEFTPHNRAVPSMTTSEYSVEDYSSDTMPGDWTIYQPTATHTCLANMVTLESLMHDSNSMPNPPDVFEDICIPGAPSLVFTS
jgi:hypothetical protein